MNLPIRPLLCVWVVLLSIHLSAQPPKLQKYIDSLLSEIPKKAEDTSKMLVFQKIAYAYSEFDPDTGIPYGEKALKLAIKTKNKKWQASANGILALVYDAKTETETAIQYNEKALALFKEIKNEKDAAAIYNNLSLIYLNQSNYPFALKNSFEALKIYEKFPPTRNTAIALEQIGHIYYEQKNYSKTQQYYERALQFYKQHGSNTDIARSISNMARVLQARNDYQTALKYLFQALKTNEDAQLETSIQNNLANIGNVYMKIGNYPEAVRYHSKALALSRKIGIRSNIAINCGNLGSSYVALERKRREENPKNNSQSHLPLALAHLEESVKLCKEIGFLAPMEEFNKYLIDAYEMDGNYRDAYRLLQENVAIKDSIFSLQSKIELSNLDTEREVELKNKDIALKEIQLQLKHAEKANDQLMYLSGICILCIAMFFLVRYFRKKVRVHKNNMADIIQVHAHTLRGPVASILGLVQLLDVTKPDDPDNTEILENIHKAVVELDEVILDVVRKHN